MNYFTDQSWVLNTYERVNGEGKCIREGKVYWNISFTSSEMFNLSFD